MSEEQQENIRGFINEFEDALYAGQEVSHYIDYPTFAKWILAHDILGTSDAGGSNMFIAKKEYSPADPTASPLEMCAPWDLDTSLRGPDNEFCASHSAEYFYYHLLFQRQDFTKTYIALYDSLKATLPGIIDEGLTAFEQQYAETFEASRALHRTLYPEQMPTSLAEQVAEVRQKLATRLLYLDQNIEQLRIASGFEQAETVEPQAPRYVYDLSGRRYDIRELPRLPRGVYVIDKGQGKTQKIVRS